MIHTFIIILELPLLFVPISLCLQYLSIFRYINLPSLYLFNQFNYPSVPPIACIGPMLGYGDIRVTVDTIPDIVIMGSLFAMKLNVANCSDRTMDLMMALQNERQTRGPAGTTPPLHNSDASKRKCASREEVMSD